MWNLGPVAATPASVKNVIGFDCYQVERFPDRPDPTPSLHHKTYVLAGPTLGRSQRTKCKTYSITNQKKCPGQPILGKSIVQELTVIRIGGNP